MAVPKYQEVMLPLLDYASNQKINSIRTAIDELAEYFQLSQQERSELLDSGRQAIFDNRVHWAKTYLVKAKLLESAGRGYFRITNRGIEVLASNPPKINSKFLKQFDEFVDFKEGNRSPNNTRVQDDIEEENEQTPEEQIDSLYRKLRKTLSDELLETVLSVSPRFFERLVVDLLLAMGYGSSLDSGEHLGQSNDGGVDGVIREDKLGLDTIYIQAKRYALDNGVGRPAIQNFVGSLMGFGATKGVFITTSYFSQHAVDYANAMNNMKIILIDGQQLATLMIEHNVGISVQKLYEIKQIDENYFPDV